MPPQANFDGVVSDYELPSSERSTSIRKIPSRFLLVEDPMKAPMNPEEICLMKRNAGLMKKSRIQVSRLSRKKTTFQARTPPTPSKKKKKKLTNGFFSKLGKSKLQLFKTPKEDRN